MMNRVVLETQLNQYMKGKGQAIAAFNAAQADLYRFDGAIEACTSLLAIERAMEEHETKKAAEEAETKQPQT